MFKARKSETIYKALQHCDLFIEFTSDGEILHVNDNFLACMGYSKEEVLGKHHSMLITADERDSSEYESFWRTLQTNQATTNDYCYQAKNGQLIWFGGCFCPIFDKRGEPSGFVKFGTDVTEFNQQHMDAAQRFSAIDRSLTVASFDVDGTILDANENLLNALGYDLHEIQGKNQSFLFSDKVREKPEYSQLWNNLKNGEFQAGEFLCSGKGGKEVHLEASYNPICDIEGRPYKIVKYAIDRTEQTEDRNRQSRVQANIAEELVSIDEAVSKTSHRASEISDASKSATAIVHTVADSSEELSVSVGEISVQVSSALDMSSEAVESAHDANLMVVELANAGQKIGEVVELINSIAEKTNLLALNATIEAARAGEAGKGFAIVASEVKSLATQTSTATDEIASQISDVQSTTDKVVNAIGKIVGIIGKMNEFSSNISTAVEQQRAVTADMSSNMMRASQGVSSINDSIVEIAESAQIAGEGTARVAEVSKQFVG